MCCLEAEKAGLRRGSQSPPPPPHFGEPMAKCDQFSYSNLQQHHCEDSKYRHLIQYCNPVSRCYMLTVAYLMLQLFDTGKTLPYWPVRLLQIRNISYGVLWYGTLPTATLPYATTQYFILHAYGVFSNGRLRLKCDGTRAETRFRLSAKRASPFKSAGASVQSTTGSRGVRISGSNAGYTMFRGSATSTVYPLHSPVSPSLPLPCVTVCHHISTGLFNYQNHILCFMPRTLIQLIDQSV
jgi:hypothetical protein